MDCPKPHYVYPGFIITLLFLQYTDPPSTHANLSQWQASLMNKHFQTEIVACTTHSWDIFLIKTEVSTDIHPPSLTELKCDYRDVNASTETASYQVNPASFRRTFKAKEQSVFKLFFHSIFHKCKEITLFEAVCTSPPRRIFRIALQGKYFQLYILKSYAPRGIDTHDSMIPAAGRNIQDYKAFKMLQNTISRSWWSAGTRCKITPRKR